MAARAWSGGLIALLLSHCGYLGLDLQDLPATDDDAQVSAPSDAGSDALDARSEDAAPELEAALLLDTAVEDAGFEDAALDDAAIEDAGAEDASAEDAGADALVDAIVDAAPMRCDLAGDWVAKLNIATTWPPSGGVMAGSGTSAIWLRYQASAAGGIVGGSLVACGAALPSVTAIVPFGETYRPQFANTLFDALPARVLATNASFSITGSGFPGDLVTMSPTAFVFGTTLSDPVNGVWLPNIALANNDQDMDGDPGVTVDFVGRPMVDALARADQGYIAARVAFGGSVTVVDCDDLAGPVAVSRFDTHFVGCHVAGGGNCSAPQRDFLDANRPLYVATSATLSAHKVADATCAVARATLP